MMLTKTPLAPSQSMRSTRYRISSGYHLVPTGEGWLIYRPDGLFARLKVEPALVAAAVGLLSGEAPRPEGPPADEIEAFLEALLTEGVLAPIPATDGRRGAGGETGVAQRSRVTVEGEGPIASRLGELLGAGGLEPRTVEPADSAGPVPDLLVCCAGWLPDAHFAARDAWCAEHGVAWHGVYAEGHRFHLGPFWLPDDPRTVRYADARARRLAAEAHPDGLEAYWRYLDAGRGVPALAPPSPAEAALVAGALAADILAWADGGKPPSHGHQLAYDRASGAWRRHPVLPVPRGLMTEAIP